MAPAPRATRLRFGIWASAVLHAALAAVALWRRAPSMPALPPVYRVELIAGPATPATPAAPPGADPAPPPAAPSRAAPTRPAPTRPAPTRAAATRAAPVKRASGKTAPSGVAPQKPVLQRLAGKGATPTAPMAAPAPTGVATPATGVAPVSAGGTGGDVVTVRTEGITFPFPGYLQNIVRQVALRFRPRPTASPVRADVAFLLHRDGSVSSIRFVTRSGIYAFDLEAQGAIEAAASARAFGPLPAGFPDDVLPVNFAFDPRVLR